MLYLASNETKLCCFMLSCSGPEQLFNWEFRNYFKKKVFIWCVLILFCSVGVLSGFKLVFFLHDRLFFISCTTYFKLNVSVFEWVIVALWQIGDQSRQGVPRLLSTVTQLGSDSSVTLKGIQWVKKMDLWFIKLFICIFYTFFLPLLSLIYPFTLTYDLL